MVWADPLLFLLAALLSGTRHIPPTRGRPPSMSSPPLVLAFLALTSFALVFIHVLRPMATTGCRLSRTVPGDVKAPLKLNPLRVSRVPAWKVPQPIPPPPPPTPPLVLSRPPPRPIKQWKPGMSVLRPTRSSHTLDPPLENPFPKVRVRFNDKLFESDAKPWYYDFKRNLTWQHVSEEYMVWFELDRKSGQPKLRGGMLKPLPPTDADGDVVMA